MSDRLKEIIIEKNLYSYGFLPLLTVMDQLEKEEEFEWCHIIQKVLKKCSDKYDFDIPKKYNYEAIACMKINFMLHHNLSGEITEHNNPYYAEKIMEEIKEETDFRH